MPDPSSTKRTDKLRQSLLFEEGRTLGARHLFIAIGEARAQGD